MSPTTSIRFIHSITNKQHMNITYRVSKQPETRTHRRFPSNLKRNTNSIQTKIVSLLFHYFDVNQHYIQSKQIRSLTLISLLTHNVVFGRSAEIPNDIYTFLCQQFVATKRAFDRFSILLPRRGEGGREVFIRWNPPPRGWIKLNTDGVSRGNPGFAGSGGICRDETGNFLSAYYTSAGHCSSMRAELIALLVGLEEARKHRFTRLIIHVDNVACVNLINNEELVSNGLKGLVAKCKELLARSNCAYVLEHCYREANRAADWLANEGVESSSSITVLISPGNELCSILRDDVSGVAIPRMLNI